MKRTAYLATLTTGGHTLATATRFAHNSAVRAGEDLVREHAHHVGQVYQGDRPERDATAYRRAWTGRIDGERVLVTVAPVAQP